MWINSLSLWDPTREKLDNERACKIRKSKIYLIIIWIFSGEEEKDDPRLRKGALQGKRFLVHNSRLVRYRLSRLHSMGQAKERKGGERESMKDSRVARACNLVCTAWRREIGETLENSLLSILFHKCLSVLSLIYVFYLDISTESRFLPIETFVKVERHSSFRYYSFASKRACRKGASRK